MSVVVLVSSCDNEPRLFSSVLRKDTRIAVSDRGSQIGSVTVNSYHRSFPSLVPVTGMSDRIFCELFLLRSPVVRELCFGAS